MFDIHSIYVFDIYITIRLFKAQRKIRLKYNWAKLSLLLTVLMPILQ